MRVRPCLGTSDHQVQPDVVHQPPATWRWAGIIEPLAGTLWKLPSGY